MFQFRHARGKAEFEARHGRPVKGWEIRERSKKAESMVKGMRPPAGIIRMQTRPRICLLATGASNGGSGACQSLVYDTSNINASLSKT